MIRARYSSLIVASSSKVTTTTSGVPGGAFSAVEPNRREPRYIRKSRANAMRPTNWSCFRRIGDEREALAYGGGWEVFRGGIAKCMVEVDKGLVGDVRSSEPKATRPLEPSERTSTGTMSITG